MIDFKNIEYLKTGNERQQKTYSVLTRLGILDRLKPFNPILTGTIPIAIDLPESDLDIICQCSDHPLFQQHLISSFSQHQNFRVKTALHYGIESTVASFELEDFIIEIFGQDIPTNEQNAYRHMVIEHLILSEKGNNFRNEIIELKRQGLKTEPAFAKLLGITGDPYLELLKLEPQITIREIKPAEFPFLKEMLYQAIFVPKDKPALPRDIVDRPELRKYFENFGRQGDFCLVAETQSELVGAIWIRLFDAQNKSYGFVDADTPELSMAVMPEYRKRGIGTKMMDAMINRLKNGSYQRISLSVDAINFASRLYRKYGFIDQFTVDGSITMIKEMY